ncbi:MAG TPA: AAA family ATPase [Sedimentisphaerales bacterium]|nr:AAA family ATPase [Sedimentisphaerales bacterium]
MKDVQRLGNLIAGGEACISIVTLEEDSALQIVRLVALDQRRTMWIWSAGIGLRDGLLTDAQYIAETETAAGALFYMLDKLPGGDICVTLDIAEYAKDGISRRLLRDVARKFRQRSSTLIMIDCDETMPPAIKTATRTFELSLPDKAELEAIIKKTVRSIRSQKPVEVGITRKGMDAMVKNLRGLSELQAERVVTEAVTGGGKFGDEDVNEIIAGKRRMIGQGGLLEYIQTPLSLDEIGGMRNLKAWLRRRKDAFSERAVQFGIEPPRGVLMLGVQGSGKSLCAKAIAAAWQLPLLRLDPGVLYNKFIGESEANLRKALYQAEMMSPVVLWIDEIEKGFASAASQSTDGGLSKRMFGTLLTWMQEHRDPVFLVATANDIEALPPELLRKGRFDGVFFVDLPSEKVREEIFALHIQKRGRDAKAFDLKWAAKAAEGFSGAEIEQVVIAALHEAFARERELSTGLLLRAIAGTKPLSVMMAGQIETLREWAKDRCVMAD